MSDYAAVCDATKTICGILEDLTPRARRRILAYFYDLIQDTPGLMETEQEILKQVAEVLGVSLG